MLYPDRITEKTFSENCNRRKSLREAAIVGDARLGPAFLPSSSPPWRWGGDSRLPALLSNQEGKILEQAIPVFGFGFYLSHAASPIRKTFNSRFPAAGSGPLTGDVKCIFTAVGLPTAELSEK